VEQQYKANKINVRPDSCTTREPLVVDPNVGL
jgi:hypothetical protein